MASDPEFVSFVAEQMSKGGRIRYRSMFGEYGIYCDDVFLASVCDNKLYIKPTDAGRKFIGEPTMAPPYPGAKNQFLIEEKIEDREWLGQLVKITKNALPQKRTKTK